MTDKISSDFNELVTKALIVLSKLCVNIQDCAECPLRDYCGKVIVEWGET